MGRKLTLADIEDLRAYERVRPERAAAIRELKARRRVPVGPFVTLVFENRETVRHQIQEMARVEKITTDEGIQTELDIYNPLIPEPGQLVATMFIELDSPEKLREWLPKLVGIERSVALRIGDELVPAVVEEQHASQLTREDVTASVHYVRFELTPEQVERAATEPLAVVINHPAYTHEAPIGPETRAELLTDLRPDS